MKGQSGPKTPIEKHLFVICFLVLIVLIGWMAFLFVNTKITQRLIIEEQKDIVQLNKNLASFSDIPGFDNLKIIINLENSLKQIPRSRHIQQVSTIFEDILSTDKSETSNIILSDFQITLDSISVNGYVSDLRILYSSPDPEKRPSFIQRFENLSFLDEIKIQNYTRSDDGLGYDFSLTAKVINNDDE
ncbi:hypothetical protein AGMMS50249_2990 [candidate division SR1 bacterium]|nr:hypothetical protein AGMMS50249_2990 [candidate division SR1 bacterium]